MMNEDLLKIVGLIVLVGFLLYILFKSLNLQMKVMEGLTNPDASSSSSSSSANGEAGNASAYASNIKTDVIKMQDSLLISKYRKDYENTIINLDDYVNLLMLQVSLNLDPTPGKMEDNIKKLTLLNTLYNSKQGLNAVMKFIDSQ
jgi:hypothetical protein